VCLAICMLFSCPVNQSEDTGHHKMEVIGLAVVRGINTLLTCVSVWNQN
jgi:hypothetical protein